MILRWPYLGVDMEAYSRFYRIWARYSFIEMVKSTRFILNQIVLLGRESGYVWLNWLCANIGLSFQHYLIVHASICMFGLWKFFNENVDKFEIPMAFIIAFGIWANFFNILRLSIALVIMYNSIKYIEKRSIKRFLLLCLIAVLFHKISLLFFITYFLYDIQIGKKVVLLCSTCFALWFVLIPRLYIYANIFFAYVGIDEYQVTDYFRVNNMLICMLLLFYMSLLFSKKMKVFNNKKCRIYYWCFFEAIIIEMISIYVPTFSRAAITNYLPFAALLIGYEIQSRLLSQNRNILSLFFYMFLLVFYIYTLMGSNLNPYIPFWKLEF